MCCVMWFCRAQKEFVFEITSRVVSTKKVMQWNIEHEWPFTTFLENAYSFEQEKKAGKEKRKVGSIILHFWWYFQLWHFWKLDFPERVELVFRAKTIYERLHSVKDNPNFEIVALFHHLDSEEKSAPISKLELFLTEWNHPYIVFALVGIS